MTVEDILAAMRAIIDAATAEDGTERDLTEDEAKRYEALEAQLRAVRNSNEIRARQQAYETPVSHITNVRMGGSARREDTLERAFEHYLRTGQTNSDITQLRAQSEGTPSAGGYTVPDGFRDKLVERMKAFGGIANVVETVTTSDGRPLEWPTLDDTGNLGELVAENSTWSASGADLTFGTASLGAYKYAIGGAGGAAVPLRVSVELLQDSAFDVQALVARKLGERIARLQAQHLVTGTGSNQPKGLVHGLTGIEIAADGAGVVYDDLINFIHSVDPAYRDGGNCRWAFNDQSLAYLKKLKDSHGDPIWRPADADMSTGLGGGTLLGYPVTIDQAFPNIAVASNTTNWGAFGDLREGFVIRRVRDITLVVNPWTRASYGQVEFSAWARMDSTQQNTAAYVALTGEQ